MTMSSAQCFWFIFLLQAIEYSKPCADIIFVLDGSGSVKQQFKQMTNMASDIAKQFDIDKKEHRIAILEFSSKTILSKWLRYPFDRIKTNNDMEKVIQNLPHIHGTTDTGRALGIVLQEFFPQHRPGLLLLVFIITDGYYRDSEEVKQNVANLVAKPNVQLFVATASRLHNIQGLLLLVNNDTSHIIINTNFLNNSRNILRPYSECFGLKSSFIKKNVTSLATAITKHRINGQRNVPKTKKHFQDLRPKGDTLSEFAFRPIHFVSASSVRTANVSSSAVMSTTSTKDVVNIKPGCLFDVVFLMDFSGGVSDKRDIYIDYVSILIRSLDLNRTAVHVAAIYYSGPKRARTLFHLRKHSRAENAIKDLQRAPSNGGTTRTGEAIYYATNEFNEKFGARKDARKMIIIFTDGHSQDNPTEASRTARNKGIELKAVSIEDENIPPDTNQIIAITGDPSDAYSSKNFNKLQSFFDEYSRRCKL
ncbi:unnamed protein product [Brugia timori]|nr:unnamed protein product [Brugia timori]